MAKGHVQRLPSGSWRLKVYAGTDPLTGKRIYLRKTVKDETQVPIELGKLHAQAAAGRSPERSATVAYLLDEYMKVAELEAKTRNGYEGYIRRTIKPALGHITLPKMRGPILDQLYARLRKCSRLCDGKKHLEHRMTKRGQNKAGDHDCKLAGCRSHVCKPMAISTIRQIHAILSGAFDAAQRWDWIDRNPADSAKLPKVKGRKAPPAPTAAEIGATIAAAEEYDHALAVYLWLVAVTGARRGEVCGLRWHRVDLEHGVITVAKNYVVVDGKRIEKDTKTHQERFLAIDPATCEVLRQFKAYTDQQLQAAGAELAAEAYVFSNDGGTTAWNPDWTTHKVGDTAKAAGVKVNIKSLRHYSATQLLANGVDLRNAAARLGHGSGGATTLRVYAQPVTEVDQRAAALLGAQLTQVRADHAPAARP